MFKTIEQDYSALSNADSTSAQNIPKLQELAVESQFVLLLKNVLNPIDYASVLQYLKEIDDDLEGSTFSYDTISGDHHLGGQPFYKEYLNQCKGHYQMLLEKTGFDFATFFQQLFTNLCGCKTARPQDENSIYKSSILKVWNQGKELRAHYDSVLNELETGQFLKSLGPSQQIMSFVLILDTPEKGGELVIYDATKKDVPQTLLPLNPVNQALIGQYLDKKVDYQEVSPRPNMLMLFKGGDAFHRVRPSYGEGKRITIGGLIMPSFDNKTMYYWG
jgi:Rps23 Pro-64 3,4-dihydroxylase Tpa1-like proline 4-hydroxylase